MQTRVLTMLSGVFPQLSADIEFRNAFDNFRTLEDKTWWVLERKYADEIKDFEVK